MLELDTNNEMRSILKSEIESFKPTKSLEWWSVVASMR